MPEGALPLGTLADAFPCHCQTRKILIDFSKLNRLVFASSNNQKLQPGSDSRAFTIMIRVEHLTKTYGEFTAVNDVSFEVQRGEIFAFLGPNGAGKTTTIKMLTTLLKPTSGKVELDGLDPIA